jgi:hypothetical protein
LRWCTLPRPLWCGAGAAPRTSERQAAVNAARGGRGERDGKRGDGRDVASAVIAAGVW